MFTKQRFPEYDAVRRQIEAFLAKNGFFGVLALKVVQVFMASSHLPNPNKRCCKMVVMPNHFYCTTEILEMNAVGVGMLDDHVCATDDHNERKINANNGRTTDARDHHASDAPNVRVTDVRDQHTSGRPRRGAPTWAP